VVFVLLVLVGVGLIYTQAVQQTSYLASSPEATCQISLSMILSPFQVSSNSCRISSNNWIQLHGKAQYNLTMSLWLNTTSNSFPQLLFNESNMNFGADFPVFENGSIVAQLNNYLDRVNTLQGNLSVLAMQVSNTPAKIIGHPYRDLGLGVVGVSIVALFMLIWNPGKFISRALDRFSADVNKYFKKISGRLQQPSNI
jgi:hypothetical protein